MIWPLNKVQCVRSKLAAQSILHLPFWQRLLHHKARRPLIAVLIGVILMITGSVIAAHREQLSEMLPIHHLLWDSIGYFIHACGCIPALRYIEPLWVIVSGGAVAVEAGVEAVAAAALEMSGVQVTDAASIAERIVQTLGD